MNSQSFSIVQLKKRIGRHFYDVLDDAQSNPLNAALGLQDSSSVGLKQYADEFRELHEEVREILRYKVESNYEGFTESLGVYRHVIESLKNSHEGLQSTKQLLASFHEQLIEQKSELQELNARSARYKRKIEILDVLEMLQQLPAKYETLVAKKQFHEAKSILDRALEAILSYDLLAQPQVKPLVNYAQSQQVQLTTRLSEELKRTLFIESSYSQRYLDDLTESSINEFIQQLPEIPSIDSIHPESNSLAYIGYVTRTLAGLNSLGDSLDNLCRTIHADFKAVVQTCTQEVLKDFKLTPETIEAVAKGRTLLEQYKLINQNALTTLATNLFNKLYKILEMQRALVEVARHYECTYDLEYVFEAVMSTVRQFLVSYIGGSSTSVSSVYKLRPRSTSDTGSRVSRSNISGPVFEFGPGDETSNSLKDFELLKDTLKRSIPGLLEDDPNHLFAETKKQQKLEVVAPAHIFNIRSLMDPAVSFFAKADKIAHTAHAREEFDTFMNRFLQQSFVPKLRESFECAIMDIADDEHALDEMQNYSSRSQLPINNCVSQFAELIGLLCQILDTGSSYRAEYAEMLVGLLDSIYDFLKLQSNALIGLSTSDSGKSRGFKIGNFVLQSPLNAALKARFNGVPDMDTEFSVYFSKRYSPKHSSRSIIAIADLLDINIFRPVALLITSIRWFVCRLKLMRRIDTKQSNHHDKPGATKIKNKWGLLKTSAETFSDDFNAMNGIAVFAGKSLVDFDKVITKLEYCALNLLFTLRTDLFLRIVYYFDQMVVNRNFHSDNRGEERDPVVDRLQEELGVESRILDEHVLITDRNFLLGDIAEFTSQLFILEGENITDMSESGQNQILANIFAFQQMLTSIVDKPGDVDFTKASNFYELFRLNPTLILEKAKEGETDLGPEELKLLLQIRHRNVGTSSSSHAFGSLSSQLSQLNDIFSGSSAITAVPAESPMNVRSTSNPPTSHASNIGSNPTNNVSYSMAASEPIKSKVKSFSPSISPQIPSQTQIEILAGKAREDRARELQKIKLQKEHEKRNAAQAEQLQRERQVLQSSSEESFKNAETYIAKELKEISNDKQESQPDIKNTSGHPKSSATTLGEAFSNPSTNSANSKTSKTSITAAPARSSSQSPLLDLRIARVDYQQQSNAATESVSENRVQPQLPQKVRQAQPQLVNYKPGQVSVPQNNPHVLHRAREFADSHSVTTTSSTFQKSSRKLPNMRVNVSSLSPNLDTATSPVTPDQPTSQATPQTPSERALNAARNVRVRQLPIQPVRRAS